MTDEAAATSAASRRPHGLAINAAANLIGSVVTSLASLAATPFLIHLMGMAAYGLVGVYTTVQAVASVLDLGMSLALMREMARLAAQPDNAARMRDFARTLEGIYWGVGAAMAVVGIALAPFIAEHWIQPGTLGAGEVHGALVLIAIATAVRWPLSLYGQGLVGLQQLVRWSIVRVVAELVRNGGAILLLWAAAPTIRNFFVWQIAAGAATVAWAAAAFWFAMPAGTERARFQLDALRGSVRFAAGTWAISVTSVLLVYLDRLVLTRALSLEDFGYYVLASTLALGLTMISAPLFQTFFPRLAQLAAKNDVPGVAAHYHRGCQWIAVAVFPLAATLCIDAHEVMLAWTRSGVVADHAAPLLALLAIATALNAAMNMPYALQLAYGWTKMTLRVNLIALGVTVPLLLWLAPRYGAIVGASLSLALNFAYVAVSVPITHTRLLPGELGRWYRTDLLLPLGTALAGALIGRLAVDTVLPQRFDGLATVAASFVLAQAMALLAAPQTRSWFLSASRLGGGHGSN